VTTRPLIHHSLFDNSWLPKTLQWLPTPPCSPELALYDFFLFPYEEITAERCRFDTIEEIHAETQEVIDTLTFENFQGCVKLWETRWNRCIHAQGDYFEGDGGN
jgi:hypothetical protein